MITQELVRELFDYSNGKLYWRKPNHKVTVGKEFGSLRKDGYKHAIIQGNKYLVHRVIFLWHHGYLPTFIDHINIDKSDNRIENLRPATRSLNQQNRSTPKNNTSGIKGVTWHKSLKKWIVQLQVNGVKKNFGSYFDIDYAKFIAEAMYHKYHGVK